ncbi:conserved hypothetical protein [Vibrio chagasii]|nr:conserved hypothetical protein [Vibrio chagasii]CAH7371273.1 conserved hypothetical protein [Vibrio chagasii]
MASGNNTTNNAPSKSNFINYGLITLLVVLSSTLGLGLLNLYNKNSDLQDKQIQLKDLNIALVEKERSWVEKHNKIEKELLKQQHEMSEEKKEFAREKAELNDNLNKKMAQEKLSYEKKIKDKLESEYEKRLTNISTDEQKLQALKNELENEIARLKEKQETAEYTIKMYKKSLAEAQTLASEFSYQAQQAKAKEYINTLMKEFSSLGVSLRHPDWCDKKYTQRFRQAEKTLSQISAVARANNLYSEYQDYINTNSRSGLRMGKDGYCESNKSDT